MEEVCVRLEMDAPGNLAQDGVGKEHQGAKGHLLPLTRDGRGCDATRYQPGVFLVSSALRFRGRFAQCDDACNRALPTAGAENDILYSYQHC